MGKSEDRSGERFEDKYAAGVEGSGRGHESRNAEAVALTGGKGKEMDFSKSLWREHGLVFGLISRQ